MNTEFHRWVATNLKRVPEFEPQEDNLSEIVNLFKEKFNFSKIKKSNSGASVWNFRVSTEVETFDGIEDGEGHYWSNRGPHVDMEIRIWKQKGKVRMGIVSTLEFLGRKMIEYHNGDPRAFLKESERRFNTNTTAKKFGI